MPVKVSGTSKMLKDLLIERRTQIQENELKVSNFVFSELNTVIKFSGPKSKPDTVVEFTFSNFQQFEVSKVENFLKSKKLPDFNVNKGESKITFSFNPGSLSDDEIENISKINFYVLLSKIAELFDQNNKNLVGTDINLDLDDINSLNCERMDTGVVVLYTIQAQLSMEDQTLMETFLNSLAASRSSSGVSMSVLRDRPERLNKYQQADKRVKGVFYLSVRFPARSFGNEEALVALLYFPHLIHMHMKCAKSALTMVNANYLNEWQKQYNRALE